MSANNSKPNAPAAVIVLREEHSDMGRYLFRLAPAALVSIVFHGLLVGFFLAYTWATMAGPALTEEKREESTISADQPADDKKEAFTPVDVDEAMTEPDTDINYKVDRIADVSVPGSVNPTEAVGIIG